jgi:peptidoglycan hydrolase-like protein with peptidoglycan-binding domain
LGYYWGKIDGAFGPITRAAIKKFQNRSNIPATGVLDGKTYNALMTRKPPRNTAAGKPPRNTAAGKSYHTTNTRNQNEAEYKDLINRANAAYKEEKWSKALDLYKKAYRYFQNKDVEKLMDRLSKKIKSA